VTRVLLGGFEHESFYLRRLALLAARPRRVPPGAVHAVPRHARDGARRAPRRAPDLRLRPLCREQVRGPPASACGGGRPRRRRAPEGGERRGPPADAVLRGVPARERDPNPLRLCDLRLICGSGRGYRLLESNGQAGIRQ
jgi:hypothetical protein